MTRDCVGKTVSNDNFMLKEQKNPKALLVPCFQMIEDEHQNPLFFTDPGLAPNESPLSIMWCHWQP